ncbi:MAG TPA: hypothetical protein VFY93_05275 [Planctomycetota bacterium]|nr:hypothetical protein [Planctomycetota bacterium]
MGSRGGRPSKLTRELLEVIVQSVRAGYDLEIAARHARVDLTTLYRWLKRGRRQREGLHAEFARAVEDAERRTDLAAGATVQQQILAGNLKAAQWHLQCKYPERYAQRSLFFQLRRLLRLAKEDGEHREMWLRLADFVKRQIAKLKPFGAAAESVELDVDEFREDLEKQGVPPEMRDEYVGALLKVLELERRAETWRKEQQDRPPGSGGPFPQTPGGTGSKW